MINIIQNTIGALGRRLGIVTKNLQLWLDFTKSKWVGGELVVKDKSPNTNNAKLFTGKALSFDGANDYVDLGSDVNNNGTVWTCAIWLGDYVSSNYSFIIGDGTSDNIGLKSSVNGKVFFRDSSNISSWYEFDYVLDSYSGYKRLVFVSNGSTISLYIDGNIIDTITPISPNLKVSRLFAGYNTTQYLVEGKGSDFQIYNKAWDSDDVAFDYNNPNLLAIDNPDSDLVVTDLKGYWALSEGDGLVAYDSSGNGNDGDNITPTSGDLIGATYVTAQDTIPQLGMMDWAKGSNLIEYSEDFTSWNSYQATTNTTTSPRGNSVLLLDFEDVRMFPTTTISNSTEYTSSIYLKANKVADVKIRNVAGQDTVISLTTNWVRYELTATSSSTSTNALLIDARFSEGLGAVGLEIALYAAQINEGSSAGNYILTDGAAAIDVTTIQNPTNKGFDILGNALRLRENAFNLDGSGYAEIADNSSLNGDANGDFYVQGWIKPNTLASNDRVITKGITGNGEWMISVGSNLGLRIYAKDVSGNAKDASNAFGTLTLNAWQMITIVINRSDNEINYYLNDGNIQTFSGGDTWTGLINNSNSVTIGVNQSIAGFFDGLQDEIVIYKGKPTQKEITNNYNVGLTAHS